MSKKLPSKCIFYPYLQKIAIIFFSRFFFKDFYEYTCIFETRMTHIEFSFYPKPINCSLSQNYNSNNVALFGFLSYISGATWHYCSIYCLDFEKLDFDLTLFIIFFFTLHWIYFFFTFRLRICLPQLVWTFLWNLGISISLDGFYFFLLW